MDCWTPDLAAASWWHPPYCLTDRLLCMQTFLYVLTDCTLNVAPHSRTKRVQEKSFPSNDSLTKKMFTEVSITKVIFAPSPEYEIKNCVYVKNDFTVAPFFWGDNLCWLASFHCHTVDIQTNKMCLPVWLFSAHFFFPRRMLGDIKLRS